MCKDQQNAELKDGETNVQKKKEWNYVTLPEPAALCWNITSARKLELTSYITYQLQYMCSMTEFREE